MNALPPFDDGGVVAADSDDRTLIASAAEELRHLPQLEMPVRHLFAPGIYIREIFMPAGAMVIGHIHRTEHFNTVLQGRASVRMDGEWVQVSAPACFVSMAGVQKVLIIEEDMTWQTIHANPDDLRDVAALEERLIELTAEQRAEKGGQTVDEWRMAANQLSTIHPQPSLTP